LIENLMEDKERETETREDGYLFILFVLTRFFS
jgi:hypothetical protein